MYLYFQEFYNEMLHQHNLFIKVQLLFCFVLFLLKKTKTKIEQFCAITIVKNVTGEVNVIYRVKVH